LGTIEYSGAFSDYSDEMKSLSQDEKKELGITIEHNGEFYMKMKMMLVNSFQ